MEADCWRCIVRVCPSVSMCFCVLTINNISAAEMDPLHLEVRPYIQSWAHWKKNPLGFIFPASAILLWCCSEICFHQADSIREQGNEKSAIEEERRGEDGEREREREEGIVGGWARRNCKEERGNSHSKWAYTSSFLYLLDFIIRYFRDNSVEWNKVILSQQKAESFWFLNVCLRDSSMRTFESAPLQVQQYKHKINRAII